MNILGIRTLGTTRELAIFLDDGLRPINTSHISTARVLTEANSPMYERSLVQDDCGGRVFFVWKLGHWLVGEMVMQILGDPTDWFGTHPREGDEWGMEGECKHAIPPCWSAWCRAANATPRERREGKGKKCIHKEHSPLTCIPPPLILPDWRSVERELSSGMDMQIVLAIPGGQRDGARLNTPSNLQHSQGFGGGGGGKCNCNYTCNYNYTCTRSALAPEVQLHRKYNCAGSASPPSCKVVSEAYSPRIYERWRTRWARVIYIGVPRTPRKNLGVMRSEKRGSDTATHINRVNVVKRKVPNLPAMSSLHRVYLWDFQGSNGRATTLGYHPVVIGLPARSHPFLIAPYLERRGGGGLLFESRETSDPGTLTTPPLAFIRVVSVTLLGVNSTHRIRAFSFGPTIQGSTESALPELYSIAVTMPGICWVLSQIPTRNKTLFTVYSHCRPYSPGLPLLPAVATAVGRPLYIDRNRVDFKPPPPKRQCFATFPTNGSLGDPAENQTRFSEVGGGGTVAERLAYSPSTEANRVQSRPGPSRIFVCGNYAGRCRRSAGFLENLPYPPPFHSGAAPYSPQSPASALKTSLLRAAQFYPLFTHSLTPRCEASCQNCNWPVDPTDCQNGGLNTDRQKLRHCLAKRQPMKYRNGYQCRTSYSVNPARHIGTELPALSAILEVALASKQQAAMLATSTTGKHLEAYQYIIPVCSATSALTGKMASVYKAPMALTEKNGGFSLTWSNNAADWQNGIDVPKTELHPATCVPMTKPHPNSGGWSCWRPVNQ
ncbi:hypothetical protein PR048_016014 [Dryococelus australis]|uniref:Uncharacterized protein n=1 Tax=Dryococelus australis TaxID=614101 RepID=A0ABQ9HIJ4_9NEOP|nr:hypothetical protein PR048_016014 [Dryococelus australis]